MTKRFSIAKIYSCFVEGCNGVITQIEVSISQGLPSFDIIGLCDSSIRESRGRIKSSLKACGFALPNGHITVSISPSYIRKSGSGFDLPIALGILIASEQLKISSNMRIFATGELTLDGQICSTPGSVIRLNSSSSEDFDLRIIPEEERSAAACSNVEVMCEATLKALVDRLSGNSITRQRFVLNKSLCIENEDDYIDFSLLKGQEKTSRAMVLAVSGWHNLLLIGSSGCGKTLAANIMHGLMPKLSVDELREVYAIHNAAGIANDISPELYNRPFRIITPQITIPKLLGNPSNNKPGEVSLASNGILFMDEMCEFSTRIIDSLREPIEDGHVLIHKDGRTIEYPSEFLFVGATNPCKCGMYLESPSKCTCSNAVRKNYLNRISAPMLDRIDIVSEMYQVDQKGLTQIATEESKQQTREIKALINQCWHRQKERYRMAGDASLFNGTYKGNNEAEVFRASNSVISRAIDISSVGGYSVRGMKKLIRVGRTIADLDDRDDMKESDILEAACFKMNHKG